MANPMDISDLERDPRLFLYTSLTSGSSHITTATSRLETILKANRIPFQAIDVATEEKARRLWQRRAGGKKLPGLVKEGIVIGDLEEVEEWNEFGELKENIGTVGERAPPGGLVGVQTAPPISMNPQGALKLAQPIGDHAKPERIALPAMAEIAALHKAKAEAAAAERQREKERAESERQAAQTAKTTEKDQPDLTYTATAAPAESVVKAEGTSSADQKTGVITKDSAEEVTEPVEDEEPATIKETTPVEKVTTSTDDEEKVPATQSGSAEEVTKPADAEEDVVVSEKSTAGSESTVAHVADKKAEETVETKTTTDAKDSHDEAPAVSDRVEALQIGEQPTTQKQPAASAEDSVKSVED